MRIFGRKHFNDRSDEELMELVGRRESGALDELYRRYDQRLLYYFHRMLDRDEQLAQDFLHDIFLKLIERDDLYQPGRRFSTWIFSIAHNMCKNEYRRRQVRQTSIVDLHEIVAEADPAEVAIDRESFQALLEQELEKLDEDHRTAFLLRHREGFTVREIAEVLGCPEGTVKSRLFNTARRLASRLQCYNPTTEKNHYVRA